MHQRCEDGLHLSKEQALCLRFAPSLPSKVTFTDGSWLDKSPSSVATRQIQYKHCLPSLLRPLRYDYNAAGEKLKAYYHIGEWAIDLPGPAPDPLEPLSDVKQSIEGSTGLLGSISVNVVRDSIEYCGNMLYENGKLDKVFVDGGYATLSTAGVPTYHFYVRDHLGSIRRIVRQDGTVERTNHYYPYGGLHGESGGTTAHRFRFTGKEYDPMNGRSSESKLCLHRVCRVATDEDEVNALNWYDFGARTMAPDLTRFLQPDPMAEDMPDVSPYAYCHSNPANKIDLDGKWDVEVHLMQDRNISGYGLAIVKDKDGSEIFRFKVRAEGVGGHNTMNKNSDTPLGIYNIPENNSWISGGSRESYGPNPRLNMVPESGDILSSHRDNIRIHGGRQETYNAKENKWIKNDSPQLKKTLGCIRAYDDDMKTFKEITDQLDNTDLPGRVYVIDDLEDFQKREEKANE